MIDQNRDHGANPNTNPKVEQMLSANQSDFQPHTHDFETTETTETGSLRRRFVVNEHPHLFGICIWEDGCMVGLFDRAADSNNTAFCRVYVSDVDLQLFWRVVFGRFMSCYLIYVISV